MLLSYTLSMPRNNSRNGRWSGQETVYAVIRKSKREELCGSYYYDFGDGWAACVRVAKIDATQARKLRKKSRGFYGYDWMIDSIELHGEIRIET